MDFRRNISHLITDSSMKSSLILFKDISFLSLSSWFLLHLLYSVQCIPILISMSLVMIIR